MTRHPPSDVVYDDPVDPRDLAEVRTVLADAARQSNGARTLVMARLPDPDPLPVTTSALISLIVPPSFTVYTLDTAHEFEQLRLLMRADRNEEAKRLRTERMRR